MKRRALAVVVLAVAISMGLAWGAYRVATPVEPALSRYIPSGALLYLQARDFSSLLADWNASAEKGLWLPSSNYEVFSRSRLFLRLGKANAQFAKAAGVPTDTKFLREVAGGQSALAIFDIGKLEFLYITRLPSGSAAQSALWQTRGKFEARSAGGVTFFLRRDAESERDVAFAVTGDFLLLATREDLLAGALQLLANDGAIHADAAAGGDADRQVPQAPQTPPEPRLAQAPTIRSIESEAWWSQAVAAAGAEGDLRMVLNLEKIVPSPYFRSYWVQKNGAEMKQYSAAITDLTRSGNEYHEERVLLRRAPGAEKSAGGSVAAESGSTHDVPTNAAASPGANAVAEIARLVPANAGVYVARANPSAADCVALLETKLLAPHFGPGGPDKLAPKVELSSGETGSSSDLETRIDEAPARAAASNDSETALKQVLSGNAILAVLQVDSTERDSNGVFVRIHSAVALLRQADWGVAAARSALADFARPSLTTGDLGIAWQETAGHLELNGLWTLNLAIRGKYLILADNPDLLNGMLTGMNLKTSKGPAEFLGGFDHARERGNFVRLTQMLDGPASNPGAGDAPAFFSGNIASLSATLAAIASERIEIHNGGNKVTQAVTYSRSH